MPNDPNERTISPNIDRTPSDLVPQRINRPVDDVADTDQQIAYDEWELLADLDLTKEQFTAIGYIINGLSARRIERLTGLPQEEIIGWMQNHSHFQVAVARLKDRRTAFLKADTLGLQIKALETMAWYLLVDPEEMNKATNKPRFTPRVQGILFQEKRRVASFLLDDFLARDRVSRIQITHDVQNSVTRETLDQMAQLMGKGFEMSTRDDIVDAEDVVEMPEGSVSATD